MQTRKFLLYLHYPLKHSCQCLDRALGYLKIIYNITKQPQIQTITIHFSRPSITHSKTHKRGYQSKLITKKSYNHNDYRRVESNDWPSARTGATVMNNIIIAMGYVLISIKQVRQLMLLNKHQSINMGDVEWGKKWSDNSVVWICLYYYVIFLIRCPVIDATFSC